MNLSLEAINRLDRIIDQHNAGASIEDTAASLNCHPATVRSFLSLVKKLGVKIERRSNSPWGKDPQAKAIMSAALKDAHRRIAALHTNGHA